MSTKSKMIIGFLLIVAGVLVGHGVGLIISELTGKSLVDGFQITGLGIGFFAAVMMWKKQD